MGDEVYVQFYTENLQRKEITWESWPRREYRPIINGT